MLLRSISSSEVEKLCLYSFIVKKMKIAADVFGKGVSYIVFSKMCFTFLNNFILTTATLIGIILFIIIGIILKAVTNDSVLTEQGGNSDV